MAASENNPEDPSSGHRDLPFSASCISSTRTYGESAQEILRLSPGQKVRLKSAYIIQCDEVIKDAQGKITELRCSYLPESKSGGAQANIKVQATIHWVSIPHAITTEVRLTTGSSGWRTGRRGGRFKEYINPDSLQVLPAAFAEPGLAGGKI